MKSLEVLSSAVVLLMSFAVASHAQTEATETPLPAPVKFEPDSPEFIARAARADAAEIEAGQLALSRSENSAVRSFAQRMIEDHQKTLAELKRLAAAKHAQIPDVTDLLHKVAMKTLLEKSGEEFDSAYLAQMKKDHERIIVLYKAGAESSKVDAEIKQMIGKTLPVLEQHKAMLLE